MGFFLKKVFGIIKTKLTIFHYICLLLLMCSFTLPFFAGSLTRDAQKEELSNYVAVAVKNNTARGKVMAISLGSNKESGALPGDEREFYNLYAVFKQENATFASGFNVDKNTLIKIPEFNNDINYSIFYSGVDATKEYGGHYKHWYYPVEFMFSAKRLYDISHFMIYISKSQADIILDSMGMDENNEEEYTIDDYEQLIKKKIVVTVNGNDVECVIGNIFYETNYYYETLKEIFKNFIICAYYCPGNLPKNNLYFFNEHSYQNEYFMKYINEQYSNKKYDVEVVKNNIVGEVDYEQVTSFYFHDLKTTETSRLYVLIIISFLLVFIVSLFNILKRNAINTKYCVLTIFSLVIPYYVFFIISRCTYSVLYFSDYSIKLYLYVFALYVGINFVSWLVSKIYDYVKRKNGLS